VARVRGGPVGSSSIGSARAACHTCLQHRPRAHGTVRREHANCGVGSAGPMCEPLALAAIVDDVARAVASRLRLAIRRLARGLRVTRCGRVLQGRGRRMRRWRRWRGRWCGHVRRLHRCCSRGGAEGGGEHARRRVRCVGPAHITSPNRERACSARVRCIFRGLYTTPPVTQHAQGAQGVHS
jgi:hypothetical protein